MSDDHDKKHEKKHKKHGHGHGGGGHAEGEHEGAPEWLISFADNVMLQMGFFVILLAMNMGEKAQRPVTEGEGTTSESQKNTMVDFAIEVRKAFNNPVNMSSTRPDDQALIKRIRQKEAEGEQAPGPEGDDAGSQTIRPSDYRAPAGFVVFEQGTATMTSASDRTVEDLARRYKGTKHILEIRGHASTLETFRDQRRGRDLAYQRAWAFGEALVAAGIEWRQIRLVAVGDADPARARASETTEHTSNQRAELVVLNEAVPDDPYATEPK